MNSPELEMADDELVPEITIFPANLCFCGENVEICGLFQVLLRSPVHKMEINEFSARLPTPTKPQNT